jgi:hypothetical protein
LAKGRGIKGLVISLMLIGLTQANAVLRMSKVSRTLTICAFYPRAPIPQHCSSCLLLRGLALRAIQPINFSPEFIFANLARGPPMLLWSKGIKRLSIS